MVQVASDDAGSPRQGDWCSGPEGRRNFAGAQQDGYASGRGHGEVGFAVAVIVRRRAAATSAGNRGPLAILISALALAQQDGDAVIIGP